jgi:hypothetical protein
LNTFYKDQQGLWEREEREEHNRLEEKQLQEEINQAWQREQDELKEKARLEEEEKQKMKTISKITLYSVGIILLIVLLRSCS